MEKNGILLNNKQRMENKMAIIKCPECGQDVSDKARICIHCGITLNEETLKKELKCTKCGEILSEQDNFCIKCGSPVMKPNQAEAGKQQTRVMNIDKSKKKKILIIWRYVLSEALDLSCSGIIEQNKIIKILITII